MTITVFILVFVVGIAAAVLAESALRRRHVSTSPALINRAQRALRSAFTRDHETLVPEFKRWISANIPKGDPLRGWLLGLPEEAIRALTIQLAAFCHELNFELVWLFNGELDNNPDMRTTLEQIVVNYCRSCLTAVELQPDIVAFRNYSHFVERVGAGDQKQVAYQLLGKLNQKGLIDAPPPGLLSGSPGERLAYARDALRTAAERDSSTVKSVLEEYWR